MNDNSFDVLIIGTGIAGLSCALKLAENRDLKIAMVTREADPNVSNTYWAQGGIIKTNSCDEMLEGDIQKASDGTSNRKAIDVILNRSEKIIQDILFEKTQTNFEKNEKGELLFTKEAAHSIERILYRGDYTGKEIQVSLINKAKETSNITLYTEHTGIDLITPLHHGIDFEHRYDGEVVVGAYLFDQKKKIVKKVMAKKTVLATGGIGALYMHHSNALGSRGDGHAMAKRAGARLMNMEYVQFHPTTFFDSSSHRRFLISEAVRGEGGILLNSEGKRFMKDYHPDGELAPRDVVARAIVDETIKTMHECVYLDISHMDSKWIQERFPTIYEHCHRNNIDMTKQPIPVVPAAHYTCGGIMVDMKGRTTLPHLYAVGEVACTGLHGANRLASTSLLEGLVWGYLAAEDISEGLDTTELYGPINIKDWQIKDREADEALIQQDWLTLKQTMWNYVGLIRSKDRLKRAEAMFRELNDEIGKFYKHAELSDSLIGLRNATEVGFTVLNESARNKKSKGCFYRRS